jgi:hypothetical protein
LTELRRPESSRYSFQYSDGFYKRYSNRWLRLAEWLDGGQRIRHERRWALMHINERTPAKLGERASILRVLGAGAAVAWTI